MAYSDDYLRQLDRRAAKNGFPLKDELRTLFFRYIQDLPEDLCFDIFGLFFDDGFSGDEADEAYKAQAKRLSHVIDLMEGEFEEGSTAITDDELRYISEGVNDFALDLTDELLMNVMKVAVSRGLLG